MRTLLVIAVTALNQSIAFATISEGSSKFGPASVTIDSQSNLEWLDLVFTQARPWPQIASDIQPGGQFAGFRFATHTELETLAVHAGATAPSPLPKPENAAPLSELISKVGQTFLDSANNSFSCGVLDASSGYISSGALEYRTTGCFVVAAPGGQIVPFYDFQSSTESRQFTGSWLVRQVPEPTSALLLAAGLLAIGKRFQRRAGDV